MKLQSLDKMKIGDVFIKGGSPGHAVIIVDMAENDKGEKYLCWHNRICLHNKHKY